MARIMNRYGWVTVPGTFAAVNLYTVPSGKKLELISAFWQYNGTAGVNMAVADNEPGVGIGFVDHLPASVAGQAVVQRPLGNYVVRAGSTVQLYQLSAGPIIGCVVGILVDL